MSKPVTLLERGSRLCERVLPAGVSADLLALHQHAGVDVRLDANVTAIQADGARLRVVAADGTFVLASLVVIGAGLTANDEVAANAGLPCAHGIIVDNHCVTADPDILAAGDVAVAPNRWAGRAIRLESWENAREQAIVAAKVLLGANARYEPLPWFWSDQHGVNLQIYGWPQPHHRAITRHLALPNSQITFLLDAGKIVSAVAINAARELRMSRKLIERFTPVLESALGNPDIKLSSM
jgi:3-phenylpropionate/trans-cinnamate dioxygenase ferredoxin reductase subunit